MKRDPKKAKKYFIAYAEKENGEGYAIAHGFKKSKVMKKAEKKKIDNDRLVKIYRYNKGYMIKQVA